jgi:type IV pilus assembly protein PilM
MSDSIWKKEISLGRKAKAPKPAPPQAPPAEEAPVQQAVQADKQSVWKKEISLGRKPKAPKAPKTPKAKPEAAVKAEKQSIWKKDLSFSRSQKPSETEVAKLAAAAAEAVAPSFAPPAPEPVAPTQVAEAVIAAEANVVQPVAAPIFEPPATPEPVVVDVAPTPVGEASAPTEENVQPVAVLPVSEPIAVAVPPPVPVSPPAPVPLPAPVSLPAPVPVAVELPPAAPQPVEAPTAPYEVQHGPVEDWMEPAQPEPWLAEPQLPPAAEADAAVVVHPPVHAADQPPLPAAKPFWKKELSFSRAPKAKVAEPAPVFSEAKQPFWKKELSFSRAPKAKAAPPAAVAAAPAAPAPPAAAPKQPFWKKELSFGRKTGAPVVASAPAPAPALAKAPRRGLSLPHLALPSFSLPSLSRGGGRSGGHQVKRLVGLKIGGSQLAAARIANNGSAELLQVARTDLPAGVVIAGELRDPDALAEALKEFFTANKLPRKNVRLGIASNRIGVRTFDIAGIDDAKQLENAIHFRAQETLPIPLDEAVLDYQILEEKVDDEGNSTKRVLLVVAYRELVDRYVAACKKAGITLSGIDLEAFALLRALSTTRAGDGPADSALVAVAVGHDRSTFAVSDGRVCEFTRVLEWGGASLNVAIARALDLAPSETEGIKRVLSLASDEVPDGITREQYALAVDAVRKQVQAFARELVSSLQFYQNQPGSLGIGEIVITGGTAGLAGLGEELQRLIGVQVRVGDPLARLKIAKKLQLGDTVGSLAVAIGLGIED